MLSKLMFILSFSSIFLLHKSECQGLTKRFVASWDFSNRKNWQNEVTPCPGRDVSFQRKQDNPIYVQGMTVLKSIDFSHDVEMVFGRESSIELSSDMDATCASPERKSVFDNKIKGYWWDPDSWECEDADIFTCNSAVPDVLRVPCFSDSVLIPGVNDTFYNIIFTDPVPTVKSLTLGGNNMSTSEFYQFSTSDEGQQRITKSFSASSTNAAPLFIESEGTCFDITGCLCHTQSPVNEIFGHMTPKCPETTCTSPISLSGFACPMCGAELSISHNGTLSLALVRDLLKRVLGMPEAKKVNGYAAKLSHNDFQNVYFVSETDEGDYAAAASVFSQLFSRDLNSRLRHALKLNVAEGSVAVKMAELRSAKAHTAGIVIGVLVVVAAALATVYLLKRRRLQDVPFMFRRMSMGRLSMRSSRSLSIPSSSHITYLQSAQGRGFVNPSFKESGASDSFPTLSTLQTFSDVPEVSVPTQRENPLFGVNVEIPLSFKVLKENHSDDEPEDQPRRDATIAVPQESEDDQPPLVDIPEVIPSANSPEGELEDETNDKEDPLEELAKSRVEAVAATSEPEKIEDVPESNLPLMQIDEAAEDQTLTEHHDELFNGV